MADNVRINPVAHARLVEVARAKGVPLIEALSLAIETYRREQLIEQMAADYEAMHAEPGTWAEERAERALWDRALSDGLEGEPPYPKARAPRAKRAPTGASRTRR